MEKIENAGYLFYKKYFNIFYDHIGIDIDKDVHKKILELDLNKVKRFISGNNLDTPLQKKGNIKSFELRTTYPGLLIGSGYSHDSAQNKDKAQNEGFKIGFFFDHSTGLPIIPGSSIKGVLKNYLSDKSGGDESYFKYLISDLFPQKKYEINQGNFIEKVFNGMDLTGKHLPIYERDIFLDAIPISGGRFFGEDYITPHIDELKNPVPIKFLKVMPDIGYKFNFILKNDEYLKVSADDKLNIFKKVITDIGLGAKTNVGYGKFV